MYCSISCSELWMKSIYETLQEMVQGLLLARESWHCQPSRIECRRLSSNYNAPARSSIRKDSPNHAHHETISSLVVRPCLLSRSAGVCPDAGSEAPVRTNAAARSGCRKAQDRY